MNAIAEWIAEALIRARQTTRFQWLLRMMIMVAGAAAFGLSWLWLDVFFGPVLLGLGLVGLVVAGVHPDSPATAGVVVVLLLWWLLGGQDVALWRPGVVAVTVGVMHLAAAWASVGPSHGAGTRRLTTSMLRAGAAYVAAVVVACGVVIGVASLSAAMAPRGLVWLSLLAVAVAAVAGVVLAPRGGDRR